MAKKVPDKMCLECRTIKPITEFYSNRGWEEQMRTDPFCKDCARTMVVSKETAREYCWKTNRVWSEALWTAAERKADHQLNTNAEYLDKKTSQKRKAEIKLSYECGNFFAVMNSAALYSYVDNEDKPYDPESAAGTAQEIDATREDDEVIWSDEWGGMYKRKELRYLDNYYERLQDEFVLDNVNIEDYARKVALASLDANTKYQRMRQGMGSAKEWQEAQDAFDKMSKSARFAESQRKENINGSLGSLSTIIMDIEINHHNEMPKVEFEPDQVDAILRDFGYTGSAIA